MRRAYTDTPLGQLHYRTGGQGTPLLLLHQDPQSSLQYSGTFTRLAGANMQVIAPDAPGYGMSDGPDSPLSILLRFERTDFGTTPERVAACVFGRSE